MPVDRNWTVPEDPRRQPLVSYDEEGNLVISPPQVVSDSDYDALDEMVREVVAILRHVGGTVQMASQRGEIAKKVVVTESYVVAYHSFTPLVRKLQDAPATDDGELTDDEIATHFPPTEDTPLGETIASAQSEVPADGDEAEAALEQAGVVE